MKRRALLSLLGLAAASCRENAKKWQDPEPAKSSDPLDGKPWLVGVFLPITGEDAAFGAAVKEGIELAVEQTNAAGGVKRGEVKLKIEDTKSRVPDVTPAVTHLIRDGYSVALLGEVASTRSIPGGTLATQKGIPMITPASTRDDVTHERDHVFRTCFTDTMQAKAAADFAVNTLGKKKVGVVWSDDDAASAGLASAFRQAVGELGARPIWDKKLAETPDFKALAAELQRTQAEIVYAPLGAKQLVAFAAAAKEAGLGADVFLGSDGWSGEASILKELEGAHYTDAHAPDAPWPASKAFVAAFDAKLKRKPTSLAAMGYDAARVLFDAFGRAADASPKAIRDAIAQTKAFAGATGTITMPESRDAERLVVIVQIKAGAPTFRAAFGPGAAELAKP